MTTMAITRLVEMMSLSSKNSTSKLVDNLLHIPLCKDLLQPHTPPAWVGLKYLGISAGTSSWYSVSSTSGWTQVSTIHMA